MEEKVGIQDNQIFEAQTSVGYDEDPLKTTCFSLFDMNPYLEIKHTFLSETSVSHITWGCSHQ